MTNKAAFALMALALASVLAVAGCGGAAITTTALPTVISQLGASASLPASPTITLSPTTTPEPAPTTQPVTPTQSPATSAAPTTPAAPATATAAPSPTGSPAGKLLSGFAPAINSNHTSDRVGQCLSCHGVGGANPFPLPPVWEDSIWKTGAYTIALGSAADHTGRTVNQCSQSDCHLASEACH